MSTATITKPSLTLHRKLKATPERVFKAWTDPAQIVRWVGPGDVKCAEAEIDPRIDGSYRILMIHPSGERHEVTGAYREIVPAKRLVFSWAWASTPERQSLVTVELEEDPVGTALTLTHEQFFDEAVRDRHAQGWNGSLDKLVALFDA